MHAAWNDDQLCPGEQGRQTPAHGDRADRIARRAIKQNGDARGQSPAAPGVGLEPFPDGHWRVIVGAEE